MEQIQTSEMLEEVAYAMERGVQLLLSGSELSLRTPEGRRYMFTMACITYMNLEGIVYDIPVRTPEYCERIRQVNTEGLQSNIFRLNPINGSVGDIAVALPTKDLETVAEPTKNTELLLLEIKTIKRVF